MALRFGPAYCRRRIETPHKGLKFLTNINSPRRVFAVIPAFIFPRERAHAIIAKTGGVTSEYKGTK